MFESARLKLTLFYLAVLLSFSLLLTFGLRAIVQAEFNHSNNVQLGAVQQWGEQYYRVRPQYQTNFLPPDQNFARIQDAQAEKTQERLTREFLLLNFIVFVVGAAVSYWYAGRTLKPIQEAHEQQKRFTSDASHELRTPLASMRLENEIFLRQKKFSDKEVREQIGSNLEEVARLERLTTSLLDLNRYETTVLKARKLQAQEIALEAVAAASKAPTAQNLTFTNKTAKASVLGDKDSLTQLVSILLDNAVKYGPKDGKVEVGGAVQGGEYVLTVRDHGKGISEADLPRIFERMYRGDKARSNSVPGHGIGLSLAQQIATANSAKLTAANHPEGGAVFSLTLPKA